MSNQTGKPTLSQKYVTIASLRAEQYGSSARITQTQPQNLKDPPKVEEEVVKIDVRRGDKEESQESVEIPVDLTGPEDLKKFRLVIVSHTHLDLISATIHFVAAIIAAYAVWGEYIMHHPFKPH